MPKRKKKPPFMWVQVPAKTPKSKIADDLKAEVTARADALLEEWKPEHIKPPPEDERFNYIVDLYTKWWRGSVPVRQIRLPWPECNLALF